MRLPPQPLRPSAVIRQIYALRRSCNLCRSVPSIRLAQYQRLRTPTTQWSSTRRKGPAVRMEGEAEGGEAVTGGSMVAASSSRPLQINFYVLYLLFLSECIC